MCPLLIGFSYLAIGTWGSSVSFHGLIAHVLVLNHIVWMDGTLSFALPKDVLVASKFWQLWIKLPSTSTCRLFLWLHVFNPFVRTSRHDYRIMWYNVLRRYFKETSKLISRMAVLFCIPVNSEWGFLLLHSFSSICCGQCFGVCPFQSAFMPITAVLSCDSLRTYDLNIFSCTFEP